MHMLMAILTWAATLTRLPMPMSSPLAVNVVMMRVRVKVQKHVQHSRLLYVPVYVDVNVAVPVDRSLRWSWCLLFAKQQ